LVRRDAADAAQFYADTFPESSVGATLRAPGDYPDGHEGDVLTVESTVCGIPCVGLNGGPMFTPNEAFSFQIATDDQAETAGCGTRSLKMAARTTRAVAAKT
jgi:predicted 3-demethylubiquinone-9 3-methyltransferase (glyoxalase superfamily)